MFLECVMFIVEHVVNKVFQTSFLFKRKSLLIFYIDLSSKFVQNYAMVLILTI